MDSRKLIQQLEPSKALFGLFFAFSNRLQAAGDAFYMEITCKQFFLIVCLSLFTEEAPTTQELADTMGSSHQNVKQILLKLEKKGYIAIKSDKKDRRKLRIYLTEKASEFAIYRDKEIDFMEHLFEGLDENQITQTLETLLHMESNLIHIRDKEENK